MINIPEDYVVLDLETTGLSPKENEIIELSALRIRGRKVVEEYSKLVKPEALISEFITNLTGIDNNLVKDEKGIASILPDFLSFVGKDVVVGHNVLFDLGFISENANKHLNKKTFYKCLDTMKISRELFPSEKHHRLCDVSARLNVKQESAHRGLVDCYTTYKCLEVMRTMI